MKEEPFALVVQRLLEGIAQLRETLRDEHFPYEEGKSVYSALHEALRLMGDFVESCVKWSQFYPHQSPEPEVMARLHTVTQLYEGIKRELG